MADKSDGVDTLTYDPQSLEEQNSSLLKERVLLLDEIGKLRAEIELKDATIRDGESQIHSLHSTIRQLRDTIGQLSYEVGHIKRKESISHRFEAGSRPRSPLPPLPAVASQNGVQEEGMDGDTEDAGYEKVRRHLSTIPDSGSEDEEDERSTTGKRVEQVKQDSTKKNAVKILDSQTPRIDVSEAPDRKRSLSTSSIKVELSTFVDSLPTSVRQRSDTVSTEQVFNERWKSPGKNSPRDRHSPRAKKMVPQRSRRLQPYPIAPDMEERFSRKIKEEIGKRYGGMERATEAAVAIQRWYRGIQVKNHYKMLQKMASRNPKKLRQRTMSMRQSRRYVNRPVVRKRRDDAGNQEGTLLPPRAMKKQISILDEFPNLKNITEKCNTPRSRRRLGTRTSEEQMIEFAEVEKQEAPSSLKGRKKSLKVTSGLSLDDMVLEGGLANVPPPLKPDSISLLKEQNLSGISEFQVFQLSPSTPERLRRDSATTIRRRMNIGINYFNRKPWKGLVYLVQRKILDDSPSHVANFLMSRLDLNKSKIGEFLGNIQRQFNLCVLEEMVMALNFKGKTIDEALRSFQTYFRMPGEAQKIEKIVEVFASSYFDANLDDEIFRSSDAAFVLSYAIMMLNTDLHSPSIKKHLTREEWLSMNRGINNGKNFPSEFLIGIYDRIEKSAFATTTDHTYEVDAIEKSILGCPRIVLSHRKVIFKCSVSEVDLSMQKTHSRYLFVFNDLLLVTKRRRHDYQFKQSIELLGTVILKFESGTHKSGLQLHCSVSLKVKFTCSCDNDVERTMLMKHLEDAIDEVSEIDRERIAAIDESAQVEGRFSPSNLSAIEAPDFKSSEPEAGIITRSGSVPENLFIETALLNGRTSNGVATPETRQNGVGTPETKRLQSKSFAYDEDDRPLSPLEMSNSMRSSTPVKSRSSSLQRESSPSGNKSKKPSIWPFGKSKKKTAKSHTTS